MPHPQPGDWQSLGSESHEWTSTAQTGFTQRRSTAPRTYRSAVVPRIASLTPLPDSEASVLAEEAALELTRLDAEVGMRLVGLAPILLRSEAASSSQIENLTVSARRLLSAEAGARSGENASQVVANTRALESALALADDISAASLLAMHKVLMAGQSIHTPGRWREEQVWIGTRSDSPAGAEYVAPFHTEVPALMEDLVSFCHRDDLMALPLIAVSHAQFETIHPFTDGNGRTGRALVQSLLRHRGITRSVAVPVSAGLLADIDGYHSALTAYRGGDVSPIIRVMSQSALRAVANTRQLAEEVEAIRASWEARLKARAGSHAWPLLDAFARRPVLSAEMAAREVGLATSNVYPALRTLTEQGILTATKEYRVGTLWRSEEVLAAIDAFAERAGRRQRT